MDVSHVFNDQRISFFNVQTDFTVLSMKWT